MGLCSWLRLSASPASRAPPRQALPNRPTGSSGAPTTTATAFPWQAAIVLDASRFSGTDAQRQFCGGTLLTPRIVQTAAHCLDDTDPDGGAPGGAGSPTRTTSTWSWGARS